MYIIAPKGFYMLIRVLFFILIFIGFLDAKFQKVKIGYIDEHFKDRLIRQELFNIIRDIEYTFERQLGFNVFDYSENDGKAINIIYMPPSRSKQKLDNLINGSQIDKDRIDDLKNTLIDKQNNLKDFKNKLFEENKQINSYTQELNNYVSEVNKKRFSSKSEYEKVKEYVKNKTKELRTIRDKFNQKQRKFKNRVNAYNQNILTYNSLINKYNKTQREIEILSRNIKEVKGVTKGYKKTIFKNFDKNKKTYTQKIQTSYMDKIEIYGFNDLNTLKAILAHEIGHLIGVGHIEQEGALMNPILQQNQIVNLELTPSDMEEFEKSF